MVQDGLTERRRGRKDLQIHAGIKTQQLTRTQQKFLGVVVALELDSDDHAFFDFAIVFGSLTDFGAPQHVFELTDTRLDLSLFLTCRVISAVFLKVAFLACSSDLSGDIRTHLAAQVVKLLLQAVVCLLGYPDRSGLRGLRHGMLLNT